MKYIVRRASVWSGETQPCEQAKQEAIKHKDRKEKVWMIRIGTLKELMNFKDKYGDIIIQDSIIYKGYNEILIYDDYIE